MKSRNSIEDLQPIASLGILLWGGAAIVISTLLAALFLPEWLLGLTASLLGESPKAYWYLSRGSAMVGYLLLWGSMALGLGITNRMARLWPGGPAALDLHQYLSLLGLGFGFFHALILLGDRYIHSSLWQVMIPFAYQGYKPVWVGLGQVAFYLWVLVVGSFYIRKRIGSRAWRGIHYASFLVFALVMIHALLSGSDGQTLWAEMIYWLAIASLLVLFLYRMLTAVKVRR